MGVTRISKATVHHALKRKLAQNLLVGRILWLSLNDVLHSLLHGCHALLPRQSLVALSSWEWRSHTGLTESRCTRSLAGSLAPGAAWRACHSCTASNGTCRTRRPFGLCGICPAVCHTRIRYQRRHARVGCGHATREAYALVQQPPVASGPHTGICVTTTLPSLWRRMALTVPA